MYDVQICPIKQLYMFAADADMSDVAVIAISSYDIAQDKLCNFFSSLCLNFEDIIVSNERTSFTLDIAAQIAKYVGELPSELDTLFVCCDSGESRSTAMAAAIMRQNGLDEMKIWRNPHYHPNPLVYTLLCSAFGIQVSDKEVSEKISVNKRALSDAMNR